MQINQNSNEADLDDKPGANLVECKLTCNERLNLAKKTLQLMDDYLKGGADLRMMSNVGGDTRALSSQGKFKN